MKQGLHIEDGHKCWYKDDMFHRDNDLPTYEDNDGTKEW